MKAPAAQPGSVSREKQKSLYEQLGHEGFVAQVANDFLSQKTNGWEKTEIQNYFSQPPNIWLKEYFDYCLTRLDESGLGSDQLRLIDDLQKVDSDTQDAIYDFYVAILEDIKTNDGIEIPQQDIEKIFDITTPIVNNGSVATVGTDNAEPEAAEESATNVENLSEPANRLIKKWSDILRRQFSATLRFQYKWGSIDSATGSFVQSPDLANFEPTSTGVQQYINFGILDDGTQLFDAVINDVERSGANDFGTETSGVSVDDIVARFAQELGTELEAELQQAAQNEGFGQIEKDKEKLADVIWNAHTLPAIDSKPGDGAYFTNESSTGYRGEFDQAYLQILEQMSNGAEGGFQAMHVDLSDLDSDYARGIKADVWTKIKANIQNKLAGREVKVADVRMGARQLIQQVTRFIDDIHTAGRFDELKNAVVPVLDTSAAVSSGLRARLSGGGAAPAARVVESGEQYIDNTVTAMEDLEVLAADAAKDEAEIRGSMAILNGRFAKIKADWEAATRGAATETQRVQDLKTQITALLEKPKDMLVAAGAIANTADRTVVEAKLKELFSDDTKVASIMTALTELDTAKNTSTKSTELDAAIRKFEGIWNPLATELATRLTSVAGLRTSLESAFTNFQTEIVTNYLNKDRLDYTYTPAATTVSPAPTPVTIQINNILGGPGRTRAQRETALKDMEVQVNPAPAPKDKPFANLFTLAREIELAADPSKATAGETMPTWATDSTQVAAKIAELNGLVTRAVAEINRHRDEAGNAHLESLKGDNDKAKAALATLEPLVDTFLAVPANKNEFDNLKTEEDIKNFIVKVKAAVSVAALPNFKNADIVIGDDEYNERKTIKDKGDLLFKLIVYKIQRERIHLPDKKRYSNTFGNAISQAGSGVKGGIVGGMLGSSVSAGLQMAGKSFMESNTGILLGTAAVGLTALGLKKSKLLENLKFTEGARRRLLEKGLRLVERREGDVTWLRQFVNRVFINNENMSSFEKAKYSAFAGASTAVGLTALGVATGFGAPVILSAIALASLGRVGINTYLKSNNIRQKELMRGKNVDEAEAKFKSTLKRDMAFGLVGAIVGIGFGRAVGDFVSNEVLPQMFQNSGARPAGMMRLGGPKPEETSFVDFEKRKSDSYIGNGVRWWRGIAPTWLGGKAVGGVVSSGASSTPTPAPQPAAPARTAAAPQAPTTTPPPAPPARTTTPPVAPGTTSGGTPPATPQPPAATPSPAATPAPAPATTTTPPAQALTPPPAAGGAPTPQSSGAAGQAPSMTSKILDVTDPKIRRSGFGGKGPGGYYRLMAELVPGLNSNNPNHVDAIENMRHNVLGNSVEGKKYVDRMLDKLLRSTPKMVEMVSGKPKWVDPRVGGYYRDMMSMIARGESGDKVSRHLFWRSIQANPGQPILAIDVDDLKDLIESSKKINIVREGRRMTALEGAALKASVNESVFEIQSSPQSARQTSPPATTPPPPAATPSPAPATTTTPPPAPPARTTTPPVAPGTTSGGTPPAATPSPAAGAPAGGGGGAPASVDASSRAFNYNQQIPGVGLFDVIETDLGRVVPELRREQVEGLFTSLLGNRLTNDQLTKLDTIVQALSKEQRLYLSDQQAFSGARKYILQSSLDIAANADRVNYIVKDFSEQQKVDFFRKIFVTPPSRDQPTIVPAIFFNRIPGFTDWFKQELANGQSSENLWKNHLFINNDKFQLKLDTYPQDVINIFYDSLLPKFTRGTFGVGGLDPYFLTESWYKAFGDDRSARLISEAYRAVNYSNLVDFTMVPSSVLKQLDNNLLVKLSNDLVDYVLFKTFGTENLLTSADKDRILNIYNMVGIENQIKIKKGYSFLPGPTRADDQ